MKLTLAACGRPVHSINCPGRLTDQRHTHSWLSHIKPSLCAQAVTGTTPRLDLRPHHAPDQPLAVASRRQRHSTVSHNGGGVTEAMPVASVYGSAEPWQRTATRAPEHDTHESISNSCQHACRHRRCALLGLLTSWAMESHASTLASTTSVVLHRVQ